MSKAWIIVPTGARIGRGAFVDVGVIVDHDGLVAGFCRLHPGRVCPTGSKWSA